MNRWRRLQRVVGVVGDRAPLVRAEIWDGPALESGTFVQRRRGGDRLPSFSTEPGEGPPDFEFAGEVTLFWRRSVVNHAAELLDGTSTTKPNRFVSYITTPCIGLKIRADRPGKYPSARADERLAIGNRKASNPARMFLTRDRSSIAGVVRPDGFVDWRSSRTCDAGEGGRLTPLSAPARPT